MDLTTRVNLVQNLLTTKEIPVSVGARLLDLNRTSIYYKGTPVSEEELACKEIIDHLHTDNPTWGARQMSAQLKARGYHVGRRKARRYMNEMDIYPIYPKMNLSKRMQQAKVCPYLLRNAVIDKPNQAWSIDITYIPIKRGSANYLFSFKGGASIMTIETICNMLLDALTEAGFNESTLFNYKGIIRRFKTFCNEKGVTDYTPEIGQAYADDVISKKTGKYSAQRHYSQGRFSRLLTSYYNTGIFDLAVMKRGKQEPSNDALKVLYREYEEHLREQYSNENTVLFYAYEVFCLFKYLESIRLYEIRDITAGTIVDYIKTTKQNRQRAILCGLRLYFTFINRQDLFAIVDGMHAYRAKRIIPLLNDGEIQKITDAIQSGAISNRDAAIVLFGLTTGIRAIDLINLRLSDIDWDNETISFKQSKTGNYVFLPLTVSLGNAIARYLSEERPDAGNDYLFVRTIAPFDPLAGHTSCYAIVKSVFKTAGIRKDARIFGMHMLRHNAASTMVKNEVPISTIAAILGHADIDSTDIYITTDEKKLRECVLPMTGISKEVFS